MDSRETLQGKKLKRELYSEFKRQNGTIVAGNLGYGSNKTIEYFLLHPRTNT